MKCITNLDRIVISNKIIKDMMKVYEYKGRNSYYKKILKDDVSLIVEQTIQKDTYFLAKLLNINISEQRMKLLLQGKSDFKNINEERILSIKNLFIMIQTKLDDFSLISNEISAMHKLLYSKSKQVYVVYDKTTKFHIDINLTTKLNVSKRNILDELNETFKSAFKKDENENVLLNVNYFIDFLNIKPFTRNNEFVGILLLYILIYKDGFDVFKYVSFFELIDSNYKEIKKVILQSNFNWEEGYSQVIPLYKYILKFIVKSYKKADEIVYEYDFDAKLNKSDNIENTINKLPELFTKEDIRIKHPYVSDSTINRTLKRLRDNDIIRPLGKGRSAKWIKLVKRGNQIKFEL